MGALSLQGLCAIAVCAAAQGGNMAALGTGTESMWLLSMALHSPIQTQLGMVLEMQHGLKQGGRVVICT